MTVWIWNHSSNFKFFICSLCYEHILTFLKKIALSEAMNRYHQWDPVDWYRYPLVVFLEERAMGFVITIFFPNPKSRAIPSPGLRRLKSASGMIALAVLQVVLPSPLLRECWDTDTWIASLRDVPRRRSDHEYAWIFIPLWNNTNKKAQSKKCIEFEVRNALDTAAVTRHYVSTAPIPLYGSRHPQRVNPKLGPICPDCGQTLSGFGNTLGGKIRGPSSCLGHRRTLSNISLKILHYVKTLIQ